MSALGSGDRWQQALELLPHTGSLVLRLSSKVDEITLSTNAELHIQNLSLYVHSTLYSYELNNLSHAKPKRRIYMQQNVLSVPHVPRPSNFQEEQRDGLVQPGEAVLAMDAASLRSAAG